MAKIIIIEEGMDWADAAYTPIVLTTDQSIEALRNKCPENQSFCWWLINKGYARYTTDEEIQTIKT